MVRQEIKKIIKKSVKQLQKNEKLSRFSIPEIKIEHPEEEVHGDYSTNIALNIAKEVKKKPIEVAKLINWKIESGNWKFFDKIKVAEPGFVNFFLSKEYLQKKFLEILKEKDKFGRLKTGKGKKINLEFISANPTGPLTLGNGRGGFCGDVLANILERAGYKTKREYYINDLGEQIKKLGHSVIGDSEAVYKGDYINHLRKEIKEKKVEKAGEKAAEFILEKMIKPTIKKMGIRFDLWFSEKSLYRNKEVEKILNLLKRKKLAYQKKGASWFKSTEFGDDKDRVLIKSSGETTYLASDIAYLENKFKRGFDKLIYIWGADHFGYVSRIKAAGESLGYKKEDIEIIIMQLVKLFEKGKEVKMSKRLGTYVTLDELVDEVGLDVARFFFLTRSPNSHLNFDLDLAKEDSEKNPVYYIQYAYARICSILRKRETLSFKVINPKVKLLDDPKELNLIKKLVEFPEIIEDTAADYQVQRLPRYFLDLAIYFHQFYRDCRVIGEDKDLTEARLSLILATKTILGIAFKLMGISAPEKM